MKAFFARAAQAVPDQTQTNAERVSSEFHIDTMMSF
jgi:hypothetical protein